MAGMSNPWQRVPAVFAEIHIGTWSTGLITQHADVGNERSERDSSPEVHGDDRRLSGRPLPSGNLSG